VLLQNAKLDLLISLLTKQDSETLYEASARQIEGLIEQELDEITEKYKGENLSDTTVDDILPRE
jgi:hypothetical protein